MFLFILSKSYVYSDVTICMICAIFAITITANKRTIQYKNCIPAVEDKNSIMVIHVHSNSSSAAPT